MSKLIDADDLKEAVYPYGLKDTDLILEMIDDAPTIDAVEVVRCKDCSYEMRCVIQDFFDSSNGFCSLGERKQEI